MIRTAAPNEPEEVGFATDGNPATQWTTSCYNDRFFNGKPGVGLVVELSGPSTGTVDIAVDSAPYQVEVYASDAETMPAVRERLGQQPWSRRASPARPAR